MQAPGEVISSAFLPGSSRLAQDLRVTFQGIAFPTTPRPAPFSGQSTLDCSAHWVASRLPGPAVAMSLVMSSRPSSRRLEKAGSLPHASCWASCFPAQLTRNLQKIFSLAADERLAAPDMPSRRRPSLQWPPPAAAASRRGHGQGESSDHIVLNRVLSPIGVGEITGLGEGGPMGEAPGMWPPCQGAWQALQAPRPRLPPPVAERSSKLVVEGLPHSHSTCLLVGDTPLSRPVRPTPGPDYYSLRAE